MKYTISTNGNWFTHPGDKITAIKAFRNATGSSLVDSKNIIERAIVAPTQFDTVSPISEPNINQLLCAGFNVSLINEPANYVEHTLRKLARRVLDENGSTVIVEKLLSTLNELRKEGLLK